jgi:DNA processing protein
MGLKTDHIVKILQLEGVGRKTAFKICDIAKDESIKTDGDLLNFLLDSFANKRVPGFIPFNKDQIQQAFHKGDRVLDLSKRANIKILSIYDDGFPVLLKTMRDRPIVLNFKGDYRKINQHIGIALVGTREPTKKGIKYGEFLGEYFGRHGYNVVSGLAKGCDTAAHQGCLKVGGMTSAVVAHGLHMIFPLENYDLANKILENGGALISEYFIGKKPEPFQFMERDRIQVGLSVATIVIQTDLSGGTMHTVQATLENHKPLAVLRYEQGVRSPEIRGNKKLIRERKAFPLTIENIDDFIKLIPTNT